MASLTQKQRRQEGSLAQAGTHGTQRIPEAMDAEAFLQLEGQGRTQSSLVAGRRKYTACVQLCELLLHIPRDPKSNFNRQKRKTPLQLSTREGRGGGKPEAPCPIPASVKINL